MEFNRSRMDKALEDFRYAYRFNKLRNTELISYRRDSVKEIAQRNYRRTMDLRPDEIYGILSRCETLYFTDLTESYDDLAQLIVDDNQHSLLSSYIITLARGKILARSDYEIDIKHMGTDVKTELAALIDPPRYVPLNLFTRSAFEYLGLPMVGEGFTGFLTFQRTCKGLLELIEGLGILTADMTTVYEFLLLTYTKRCK